ncbi:hypothetical protein L6452_03361 [Arctium lappa]|uniref:Uncharacterized protein n=1 Tax=Arctium lappa TaxID=4217 RepID=A0ACB9FN02_ARCLA|nr:hypothetical protein L6452_03361 [Arctium lappa]
MASSQSLTCHFFFFFSLVTFSYAATDSSKPTAAYHFSIRKNETTRQYYFEYELGSPPTLVDALIDLGAPSVWIDCRSFVSSSYKRVSCGSDRCKKAHGSMCIDCNSIPNPHPKPGCSNTTCAVLGYNRFRQYLTAQELSLDTLKVSSTDGRYIHLDYDLPKFQFSCSYDDTIVTNFPGEYTKGLVGFARTKISYASQISSSFKLAKKFALCIPSSTENGLGSVFIGGGPYYMPPRIEDQSLSFVSTPLLVNPVNIGPSYSTYADPSDEYFIIVKGIEVSGKRAAFNSSLLSFDKEGYGGTKISTIDPFTTLQSSIYNRLVKDFVKAATGNKIKRVKSVAPFGACFDSRTAPKTITGPAVPDIDLVLEGKTSVRLRLYGSNSMVEVKKNVICLAFIDGGAQPNQSIVLGGHQLEDRLLEFDLAASKLGFTSSLLVSNTSCSHDRLF